MDTLLEFEEQLAELRGHDPALAAEFAGFTGIEQVLQWMTRREPGRAPVDIVAQDEFHSDFLVRLSGDGRWVSFGVT
jgi:hypothetical protein